MTTPLTPAERDELRERNEFSQPHDRAYALWSEIVALLDERDRLAKHDELLAEVVERQERELDALRTQLDEAKWLIEHGVPETLGGYVKTGDQDLADRCDEWDDRAETWLLTAAVPKSIRALARALGGDPQ